MQLRRFQRFWCSGCSRMRSAYIFLSFAFSLLPSIGPWTQYPGLSLQDTLDRLQTDVENLKRNLSSTFLLSERYTDQLKLMDNENAQLRQGLINFLQRFATVEAQTAEMGQGMDHLQSRLQSVQSEVSSLSTKSRTRLGKIERTNGVWRQNFKTVNKALRALKRKIKFRVPV